MAELQAPRGMSDLLPEDEALWRFVRDTSERVAGLFGYSLISTPIVEDVRVFARTSGDESDIVSKEMYVFEDRGGGRLALRPEGTASVCRAYLEHGMASRPQPVRLYYFGPMFRYDRPQAGRYRQLWQFGAECIGDPSPAADAEAIELQHAIFRELGLDNLVLRINSIGTAETRRDYVEHLREHLRPHIESLSHDSQRRLETNALRILDSKEDAAHPAVLEAPSILDHLSGEDAEHFAAVRSLLDAAGVAYEVDHSIVRGLDYYARTVWEVEPPSEDGSAGGQATVGAGGRYDGLIELLGGPPTPGTGFATGIERTLLNMRARGVEAPEEYTQAGLDIYLVIADPDGQAIARRIASGLRAAGFSVVVGDPNRSVRAQMRLADRSGARLSEVIGARELNASAVTLRDLVAKANLDEPTPLDSKPHEVLLHWLRLERQLQRLAELRHPVGRVTARGFAPPLGLSGDESLFTEDELELITELRDIRDTAVHGREPPATRVQSLDDYAGFVAGLEARVRHLIDKEMRRRRSRGP